MTELPGFQKLVVDEPNRFGSGQYDLATAVRMLEERWKLMYPALPYHALVRAPTTQERAHQEIVGETATTGFDVLWGEPVDRQETWRQPHLSWSHSQGAVEAAEPEQRAQEVLLHIRIMRAYRDEVLRRVGFDLVRGLIGSVPTSLCEQVGIKPMPGDRLRWNDEWYEVMQVSPRGWYRNTTYNLLWYLSLQSARRGS